MLSETKEDFMQINKYEIEEINSKKESSCGVNIPELKSKQILD